MTKAEAKQELAGIKEKKHSLLEGIFNLLTEREKYEALWEKDYASMRDDLMMLRARKKQLKAFIKIS